MAGARFVTEPEEMFALDRFHPSSAGYRRTAKALLPAVLVALGHEHRTRFGHHAPLAVGSDTESSPERHRTPTSSSANHHPAPAP